MSLILPGYLSVVELPIAAVFLDTGLSLVCGGGINVHNGGPQSQSSLAEPPVLWQNCHVRKERIQCGMASLLSRADLGVAKTLSSLTQEK